MHLDADGSEAGVQTALHNGEEVLLCRAGVRLDAAIDPAGGAVGGLLEPAHAGTGSVVVR